jgi:hypothetical protein
MDRLRLLAKPKYASHELERNESANRHGTLKPINVGD